MPMLIDKGDEVVLRIDGVDYRPDDRLPDKTFAKYYRGLEQTPGRLWKRFRYSGKRRSFRKPRQAEKNRQRISARVDPDVVAQLEALADGVGMKLSPYVAKVLKEHVDSLLFLEVQIHEPVRREDGARLGGQGASEC